jgi:hypothetical protein
MVMVDFYLDSTESATFREPRRCWFVRRISFGARNDGMIVQVDPVVIGQAFGLGGRDISQLIIAPRYKGDSLYPVSEWPLYVYVMRPLIDDAAHRSHLEMSEVELIAWAELHPGDADAM